MRVIPLLLLLTIAAAAASAGDMRDPMRPAGAAPAAVPRAAPSALKLEGVIVGHEPVAIVNGRVVRAGDTIAGATILEVLADGVRYSRAGRIQTLLLPGARDVASVRVAIEVRKP